MNMIHAAKHFVKQVFVSFSTTGQWVWSDQFLKAIEEAAKNSVLLSGLRASLASAKLSLLGGGFMFKP